MLVIPGYIISILTFPGVIIHEFAHMVFCRLKRIPVYDVKYFQFDTQVQGYVVHDRTDSFRSAFLISIGPFIINTALCLIMCFPATLRIFFFDDFNLLTFLMLWLGVSIGMHAFPSIQDAENVWDLAKIEAKKNNVLAILSFPLVIVIISANVLRAIWFDAIYGVLIGIVLPERIIHLVFFSGQGQ